ncbi:DUF1801 domain-containing protein [Pedobacter cryoconitis]|uniref:YdhG-like domain-containing protein n=1 Tax=Pedobacter cryoconitis TaxID=188932 RepID=A0A7X0J212_9SPHI|nr:DUF1801 domain-containing protein [Pedobacter cryoconitis]MBB6498342.1 hypothetical protein [Pedobacter cryoconitis]
MAKNKTTETTLNVNDFIDQLTDPVKKEDSSKLIAIMKNQTGFEAKLWGSSIIGFGSYHYKYESGHEGDAPLIGFSPRSSAISLYLACGFKEREDLLKQLGKYKTGKSCIYIKRLSDIDSVVLTKMIDLSFSYSKGLHPEAAP